MVPKIRLYMQITLQRNTIDVSGTGQITIGELPQGVDNSSITWVPVRLYDPADGGLNPPSFAADEIYPLCVILHLKLAGILRHVLKTLGNPFGRGLSRWSETA